MAYLSFIIKQTNYTTYDCVFIPLSKYAYKKNNKNKLLQNTKYNQHSYTVSVQLCWVFMKRKHVLCCGPSWIFGQHKKKMKT